MLDHAFDNDFEQNQTIRYPVTMRDVGEPIVCKICQFTAYSTTLFMYTSVGRILTRVILTNICRKSVKIQPTLVFFNFS